MNIKWAKKEPPPNFDDHPGTAEEKEEAWKTAQDLREALDKKNPGSPPQESKFQKN
ncbi:MAG: hypothetical protein AB1352_02665 [Patescibacteria group bacterium]